MIRYLTIAPFSLILLFTARAHTASLTLVDRSTWDGGVTLPSYVEMHVYVPDTLASNPALVVSAHSCGGNPDTQFNNMNQFRDAADSTGDIILIIPHNPGRNCWDVGSPAALTHDGGGDTHAIAQMVRHALSTYNADPGRVYVSGGSSGGMMTQAMLGVYPELFMAGAARAGVPCGCWAESYDDGTQWSGPCATGSVTKTAQEWGDSVRSINPDYTGHRPRVMLFHGDADPTIDYANMVEAIKEWTNVLGLSETPTSEDTTTTSIATYNRQFWESDCGVTVLEAWTAPGRDHNMAYEQDAWIRFFGLDVVGGPDPEAACSGTGGTGTGGTGGAVATGGAGGAGGPSGGASGSGGGVTTGGVGPTGGVTNTGGAPVTGGISAGGTGGDLPSGGTSPTGGVVATGGLPSGGASPTGGLNAAGGAIVGSGGSPVGANGGTGGTVPTGGTVGSSPGEGATGSEGCGCRLGTRAGGTAATTALLLSMLGLVRRRRRTHWRYLGQSTILPKERRR